MSLILIADDDLDIREVLQVLLEEENHEILTAEDGASAIKELQSRKVDLVIMDLIMPGQEGIETIAKIKRDSPKTPIIAISGGGINDPGVYFQVAQALGADRSLRKPFKKNELLDLVDELLS